MGLFRKILLTLLYPFWFFLGKTWIGNFVIGAVCIGLIPFLVYVFFPEVMSGDDSKDTGIGMGMFSILLAPFLAMGFIFISVELECYYEEYGYRIKKWSKR